MADAGRESPSYVFTLVSTCVFTRRHRALPPTSRGRSTCSSRRRVQPCHVAAQRTHTHTHTHTHARTYARTQERDADKITPSPASSAHAQSRTVWTQIMLQQPSRMLGRQKG
jgi:hypothetical protein